VCELCQQGSELGIHVLWGCRVARDVWAGNKGRLWKSVGGEADFIHLFKELMDRLSREELEVFPGAMLAHLESKKLGFT